MSRRLARRAGRKTWRKCGAGRREGEHVLVDQFEVRVPAKYVGQQFRFDRLHEVQFNSSFAGLPEVGVRRGRREGDEVDPAVRHAKSHLSNQFPPAHAGQSGFEDDHVRRCRFEGVFGIVGDADLIAVEPQQVGLTVGRVPVGINQQNR